jgi:hypothetical protein
MVTIHHGIANTPLAQYTVAYQPDKKHFRQVGEPRICTTQYQSPRLALWDSGAVEWYPMRRLHISTPARRRPWGATAVAVHAALFA